MVNASYTRIATVVLGAICFIFLLISSSWTVTVGSMGFFFAVVLILLIISSVLLVLDCMGLMSSDIAQKSDLIYHLIGGILLLIAALVLFILLCMAGAVGETDYWAWWIWLIADILGIVNSILYIYIGAHLCKGN